MRKIMGILFLTTFFPMYSMLRECLGTSPLLETLQSDKKNEPQIEALQEVLLKISQQENEQSEEIDGIRQKLLKLSKQGWGKSEEVLKKLTELHQKDRKNKKQLQNQAQELEEIKGYLKKIITEQERRKRNNCCPSITGPMVGLFLTILYHAANWIYNLGIS